MVEASLTLLITIISTIIITTMASIFICCWSKKDSREITQRKNKSTKEESKKDKSSSPAPVVGKSENGAATEIQSASRCEMKLPLLSSPALEEISDDIGNFSAVQRETEILRSYRKPPPPKRARQSRVPRALKTGTKSQDIFTELNDEDSNHGSDKENADFNDDADNILLRTDKEKTTRDARSSMLAEIEQTLATLHMAEQPTAPLSADSPLLEGKSRITGLVPRVAKKDNADEKVITVKKPEVEKRSSKIKTEPASTAEKESPKFSPIAKPRKVPKVSPKPSPKARSKLSRHDDITTASIIVEKPSDSLDSTSFTSSRESNTDDIKISYTILEASPAAQPPNVEKEAVLTSVRTPEPTTSAAGEASDTETTTNNTPTQGHTRSESPSEAAHTNLLLTEHKKFEDKANSTSSSSELAASSDTTKTKENHDTTNRELDEDTVTEISKSIHVKNKKEDSHSSNQAKSENQTFVSNGEKTVDTTHDQETSQEDVDKPTTTCINDKPARVARQASDDRETRSRQRGNISRGRSEETGKQRRESTEDQTGKGKTSKIPVRAGSKHRSSSPTLLSAEKTSSPTN